ncbi:hypothetical protein [Thermus tenuipuniceus]|uniref:hypothetical protein n=1 Tax=Thermus tenuipuniceus TaxID=2078690 RepID=UPI000CFA669C|nr:hypothetical protein [Thermus tenuipuniceus]
MPFARALAFASLLALAWAKPLVSLEGYPGEARLLVFQGAGPVEVPEGFLLLLPPEAVDGVVSLAVRVPSLPPGQYPFRVGGEAYPFRILPRAKALLLPPPPLELAPGEEAWAEVGVRNLGNVPLPTPRASGLGVEVRRVEAPSALPPGGEGRVRLLLRGTGKPGRVLLEAEGAWAELPVMARPAPPPPFHDWARLPSRLVAETPGRVRLEGQGTLPGPEGQALGRLAYRLSPEAASLDFSGSDWGFGVGLGATSSLSLRYAPRPYSLEAFLSTGGQVRLGGAYAEGGLRLQGRLGLLPSFEVLSLGLGYQGQAEGLSYGTQAGWEGGVGRLQASLGQGPWRTNAHLDTRGGFGLQGVASVGGGWNLGAGVMGGQELWLQGVLGIPVWGTVEVRGEYAPGSGRYRLTLFHVEQDPREGLVQQLFWDGEALRYGVDYRLRAEDLTLRAGASLGTRGGGGVRLGLEAFPLTFQASANLGPDLRPTGFSLAGALAFDLPLYPMPWPEVRLRFADLEGRPLAASVAVGSYRYQAGPEGLLVLRLPPGRHTLRALGGLAFANGAGLAQEVALEAKPQEVHLALAKAHTLRLDLFPCPPKEERLGFVYGLPGLNPEALLRQARGAFRTGPKAHALRPGEAALLPEGRLEVALEGPLARAYALATPTGEPLTALKLERDMVLRACLVPSPRPLDVQEVPLQEERP